MAKVLTADGRGSVKMLTKMVYPSLDLAGTLTFWWGLRDTFIRPKKPCLKTVGTSQNWCLRCYCCGLFTDYISARAHYHRVCSTIVPSVACQTTEGEYLLLTTLPTYWYLVVTLQVHTNIIVACQTTEVTYRSPTLSFLQARPCADTTFLYTAAHFESDLSMKSAFAIWAQHSIMVFPSIADALSNPKATFHLVFPSIKVRSSSVSAVCFDHLETQ